ncbi:hypothetical protein LJC35_06300 [Parabacteroides sp. OttesenSCG-928-N08]|nr:hypothetical protein [Parabacteroides sp. OttesenSCG-928-N08]
MSVAFRKVNRKVLAGPEKDTVKVYAQAHSLGHSTLEKLCNLISARSAISAADVKSVLDSLNWVFDLELRDGRIVQLGDLGSFRISLSSNGADTEEEFNAGFIRKSRLIFQPGKVLRDMLSEITYTPLPVVEVEANDEETGG